MRLYNNQDLFVYFSNYGNPPVDFAAPGVDMVSSKPDGGVVTYSGILCLRHVLQVYYYLQYHQCVCFAK